MVPSRGPDLPVSMNFHCPKYIVKAWPQENSCKSLTSILFVIPKGMHFIEWEKTDEFLCFDFYFSLWKKKPSVKIKFLTILIDVSDTYFAVEVRNWLSV